MTDPATGGASTRHQVPASASLDPGAVPKAGASLDPGAVPGAGSSLDPGAVPGAGASLDPGAVPGAGSSLDPAAAAQIQAAPLPTATTLRRRQNALYQLIRLIAINLKMIRVIISSHRATHP